MVILTSSAEETLRLGKRLGDVLMPQMVVGICGDLGAGKTCLVKGIGQSLGIRDDTIISPTFTLVVEHYTGRVPLYHLDLFRLEEGGIEDIGLEDYLFGSGITVIEWFEYLPDILKDLVNEHLFVSLELLRGDERKITIEANGARYENVVRRALLENRKVV